MSFGGLTRSVPDGGEQPRNRGRIGHRSGGRSLSFGIFTRGFGAGSPHRFCRPQNTSFATSHLALRAPLKDRAAGAPKSICGNAEGSHGSAKAPDTPQPLTPNCSATWPTVKAVGARLFPVIAVMSPTVQPHVA